MERTICTAIILLSVKLILTSRTIIPANKSHWMEQDAHVIRTDDSGNSYFVELTFYDGFRGHLSHGVDASGTRSSSSNSSEVWLTPSEVLGPSRSNDKVEGTVKVPPDPSALLGTVPSPESSESIVSHSQQLVNNSLDLHQLCRTMGKYLPVHLYKLETCARCYQYIINENFFYHKWSISMMNTRHEGHEYYVAALLNTKTNSSQVEFANVSSTSIRSSFKVTLGLEKWETCCHAAVLCCSKMLTTQPPGGEEPFCPRTWDGWQCWEDTPAGSIAKGICPSYSYLNRAPTCGNKMATKTCLPDGTWLRPRGTNEWTNYTSCGVEAQIRRRLYVHVVAYSVSVAALQPALVIYFSYRQLRVHRFTLHKHLCISLLLEAVSVIVFKLLQLHAQEIIQESPSWCSVLYLITKYVHLCNYGWYLSEGYYLHKLISSAFAEQRTLVVFYIIGWVAPFVPMAFYTSIRGAYYDTSHCWMLPVENLEWIINIPPLMAIVINIFFVINIIRILLSKVRATRDHEPSQFRKAVRATMIVIPLFGLQYVVTIYRPVRPACDWLHIYQTFNNVIEGSTGAIVAFIFCYTNGEVKALLGRSISRFRDRRTSSRGGDRYTSYHCRSMSTMHTTVVDSQPNRRNSSMVAVYVNPHLSRHESGTSHDLQKNRAVTVKVVENSKRDSHAPLFASPKEGRKKRKHLRACWYSSRSPSPKTHVSEIPLHNLNESDSEASGQVLQNANLDLGDKACASEKTSVC